MDETFACLVSMLTVFCERCTPVGWVTARVSGL